MGAHVPPIGRCPRGDEEEAEALFAFFTRRQEAAVRTLRVLRAISAEGLPAVFLFSVVREKREPSMIFSTHQVTPNWYALRFEVISIHLASPLTTK